MSTPEDNRTVQDRRKNGPWTWCCRCIYALKYLFLAACIGLFYLNTVGLPDAAVARVNRALSDQGLSLECTRLRLDLLHGLVADGVTLIRQQPGPSEVVLASKRVYLHLEWIQEGRFQPRVHGIKVVHGRLHPAALQLLPATLLRPLLTLDDLNCTLVLGEDVHRLEHLSGSILGLAISGNGDIRIPNAKDATPPQEQDPWVASMSQETEFFDTLWQELERLTWSPDSEATFSFSLDPVHPSNSTIRVEAEGSWLDLRGIRFSDWSADARLQDQALECRRISVVHRDREARMTGRIDLRQETVQCSVYSDLVPECLLPLLPWSWSQALTQHLSMREGHMEAHFECGPIPFDQVGNSFAGWFRLQDADLSGLWVREAFADVTWEAPDFSISNLSSLCGTGTDQGLIQGSIRFQTDPGNWDADVRTTLDPILLIPVAPDHLHGLIRRFTFTEHNPDIQLRLAFNRDPTPGLTFTGSGACGPFQYNGVHLDGAQVGLNYNRGRLDIRPMLFQRQEEGWLKGWLSIDAASWMSAFDFESTFHPLVLGGLIGTNLGSVLKGLKVDGQGTWTAMGLADLVDRGRTDLHATARLEEANILMFPFEKIDMTFDVSGSQFNFQVAPSSFCAGTAIGSFQLDLGEQGSPFTLSMSLDDASMSRVISLTDRPVDRNLTGRVQGELLLSGPTTPYRPANLTGEGRIAVQNGSLFRIPLFGGLSQLLSWFIPGLGFTSQTDLTASYSIKDNQLSTTDLIISGNLLTVLMEGQYTFDDQLRFDVKARPLSPGLISDVVNLVTFPISKLFELRLRGSLTEPDWSMKRIPKELRSTEEPNSATPSTP